MPTQRTTAAINPSATRTIIVTCEHGGHRIPPAWRQLFRGAADVLKSHRGWDPGALKLAREFARQLQAPLYFSETSRLLIELNRSPGHPRLFSEFTSPLPEQQRQLLINTFYLPYRRQVGSQIARFINRGSHVLHVSVHSFTPVWNGQQRGTSIGLLYDPRRPQERDLCRQWKQQLQNMAPDYTIHSNQPYRGIADGFTTQLRKQHPAIPAGLNSGAQGCYAGIEVEVNQSLIQSATLPQIHKIATLLVETLPIQPLHNQPLHNQPPAS